MQRFVFTAFFITLFSCCVLAQQPVRIITAGSALTETVCALGDCGKIVAADRTSLYPAEIQKLPSIGYRSGINAEGILSLQPTLVIAEKEYVDESTLQQLRGAPVKLVVIERKLNIEGTRSMIKEIAAALGREAEGKKLIEKIDRELLEAKSLLEKKASTPKVLCIYNRGTATISAGGTGTFAEILPYAGAVNAMAGTEGYKTLNTEALIASNPDYLLMVTAGFESLGGMPGVLKLPGVPLTAAGKKQQVVTMESLRLTNFGPRIGETVKELVYLLHPELQSR